MTAPAVDWPERAHKALEAVYAVAREYDQIGGPMERLAREAGMTAIRVPISPLQRYESDINRMRRMELHAPIPSTVAPAQIDPLDDPDDDDVRETARAAWFLDGKAV
ncbi:MAG: hypothetical protein M3N47_08220 [Chloroflexota bacterium]|nr:hypothetical protein [Chloroflexota bacterium]